MENEIWKDIPNYEGHYQVSNLGRVKSFKYDKEILLTPCKDNNGYYHINLHLQGVRAPCKVHVLIASSFLGHIQNGKGICVDHIDNDRSNNNLMNLQLISHRENCSKDKKNGASKYVGVSFDKRRDKWFSRISVNKKNIHLGCFINEIDAHLKYQEVLLLVNNGYPFDRLVEKYKRKTSSKYKGVSWNKDRKKWSSSIVINGKQKYLGVYNNELEASKVYQNKLKELKSC